MIFQYIYILELQFTRVGLGNFCSCVENKTEVISDNFERLYAFVINKYLSFGTIRKVHKMKINFGSYLKVYNCII